VDAIVGCGGHGEVAEKVVFDTFGGRKHEFLFLSECWMRLTNGVAE
jgi:hypothetical protein